MACLLLQPDRLFGRSHALTHGALLSVLSCGFVRVALALGSRLLTARLGLGLTLGVVALTLDPLLTLAGRYGILEAVVLKLSLGLLRLERRFRRAVVRFGRRTSRLRLGVNLRLLQTPLARQVVAAQRGPDSFFCPTGNFADQTTGGPLGILSTTQLVIHFH